MPDITNRMVSAADCLAIEEFPSLAIRPSNQPFHFTKMIVVSKPSGKSESFLDVHFGRGGMAFQQVPMPKIKAGN